MTSGLNLPMKPVTDHIWLDPAYKTCHWLFYFLVYCLTNIYIQEENVSNYLLLNFHTTAQDMKDNQNNQASVGIWTYWKVFTSFASQYPSFLKVNGTRSPLSLSLSLSLSHTHNFLKKIHTCTYYYILYTSLSAWTPIKLIFQDQYNVLWWKLSLM